MSAPLIRTEIDRLFGDMSRDNRTTLRDMRAIARHADMYADLLDDWDDDYDDFDDYDYEDHDYDDYDDFED